MPKIRSTLSKKNEYYISPHAFYAAYHQAMRYTEWLEEYEAIASATIKAVDYEHDGGSGSYTGDPTSSLGAKLARISKNLDAIRWAAKEAGEDLYTYILYAVTNEGVTYKYLRTKKIPCSRNEFYQRRRKFYYLLSKRMEIGDTGDNNL